MRLCQKQNLAYDWLLLFYVALMAYWPGAAVCCTLTADESILTVVVSILLRGEEIHRSRLQTHFTTLIKRKIACHSQTVENIRKYIENTFQAVFLLCSVG